MSDIRWLGHTHQEIYDMVRPGPGAAVSKPAEDAWKEAEALILRIDERIASAMAGSAAGWEGSAADATRSAMAPLTQWALDAARHAKLTAGAVAGQGVQANYVRDNMPEPQTAALNAEREKALTDPTYIFHGLDDMQRVEEQAANDAARAAQLMDFYTDNSEGNRQFWVPSPFPPQVTVITDPVGPGPGGPGAPGIPGPGSPAPTAPAEVPPSTPGVTPPPPGAAVPPGITPPVAPGGPGAAPGAPPAPPFPPAVVPPVLGQPPGGNAPSAVPPAPTAPAAPALPPAPTLPTPPGGTAPPGSTPPRPGAPVVPPGLPGAIPPGRPGGPTPGGVRPVVPGAPPRPTPAPSWRDIVPGGPAAPGARFPAPGVPDPDRALPPGTRAAPEPLGARLAAEPAARTAATAPPAATRPGVPGAAGGLYPPLGAGLGGRAEQERRRPDYLLDDTDAFGDDRWFTPAVITPDDGPPPRR